MSIKANKAKPYGSIENPILTDGVDGQFEYLSRLLTHSGQGFFFHRLGSCETPAMEHSVDIYELIAFDNSERWTLAMSLYHSETSNQPPEGLFLLPFPQPMTFGVNTYVNNFPLGLPDILFGEVPKENFAQIGRLLNAISGEEWKVQKNYQVLVAPETLQMLKPR